MNKIGDYSAPFVESSEENNFYKGPMASDIVIVNEYIANLFVSETRG